VARFATVDGGAWRAAAWCAGIVPGKLVVGATAATGLPLVVSSTSCFVALLGRRWRGHKWRHGNGAAAVRWR